VEVQARIGGLSYYYGEDLLPLNQMCHLAFSMWRDSYMISDLMVCHNCQRHPWIKLKLGQIRH
jgi:hypothetical protein